MLSACIDHIAVAVNAYTHVPLVDACSSVESYGRLTCCKYWLRVMCVMAVK